MTRNQALLANLTAICAISKAKVAHLPSAEHGVMSALEEAILERKAAVARLLVLGQFSSLENRQAKDQLRRWESAWKRNR